jgi:hypothetical protein
MQASLYDVGKFLLVDSKGFNDTQDDDNRSILLTFMNMFLMGG